MRALAGKHRFATVVMLVVVLAAIVTASVVSGQEPAAESAPSLPPAISAGSGSPHAPQPQSHHADDARRERRRQGDASGPGHAARRFPGRRRHRAAGGPVPGTDYIALNLARRLTDGEQIYVGIPAPPTSPHPKATRCRRRPARWQERRQPERQGRPEHGNGGTVADPAGRGPRDGNPNPQLAQPTRPLRLDEPATRRRRHRRRPLRQTGKSGHHMTTQPPDKPQPADPTRAPSLEPIRPSRRTGLKHRPSPAIGPTDCLARPIRPALLARLALLAPPTRLDHGLRHRPSGWAVLFGRAGRRLSRPLRRCPTTWSCRPAWSSVDPRSATDGGIGTTCASSRPPPRSGSPPSSASCSAGRPPSSQPSP